MMMETDDQLFPYALDAPAAASDKKESRSARRRHKAKAKRSIRKDEDVTSREPDISVMSAAELAAYRRVGMANDSYTLPGQTNHAPCSLAGNAQPGVDREALKRAIREKRDNRSRVGRGQMRSARAMYKEHQRQASLGLVDNFPIGQPEEHEQQGQGQGFQFNSGLSPEEMLRNVPDGLIDKSKLSHFIQQVRQGKVPVAQLMREYDRANK